MSNTEKRVLEAWCEDCGTVREVEGGKCVTCLSPLHGIVSVYSADYRCAKCGASQQVRCDTPSPESLRAALRKCQRGLRDAIRALEEGRIPQGGNFLDDLRALLTPHDSAVPVPTEGDVRERRGEAMHEAVTGCPDFWADMDDDEREEWRATADNYHTALAEGNVSR